MRRWLSLGVCLLLVAVAATVFLPGRLVPTPDSITYINGARALAAGQGYTSEGRPVTHWPPGYSALLAVMLRSGFGAVPFFKALNMLLLLAACALYWRAWCDAYGRWFACALVTASGLFFPVQYYAQALLPEMLFLALVALFVVGAGRCMTSHGRWAWGVMAASAALLPLVRYAGVAAWPVCMGVALYRAWRTDSLRGMFKANVLIRLAVLGLVIALPLLLLIVRNRLLTGAATTYDVGAPSFYVRTLGELGITQFTWRTRIWVNLRGYLHIFAVPDQYGIARVGALPLAVRGFCVLVWALIVGGWVLALRKPEGQVAGALSCAYAAILLANNWYDMRYLLPVLPILFLYLCLAIAYIGSRLVRRCALHRRWAMLGHAPAWRLAAALGLLLLNGAFLVAAPQAKRLRARYEEGEPGELQRVCETLRALPDDGAILVFGQPGFVPIWTERKAIGWLEDWKKDGKHESWTLPPGVAFVIVDRSSDDPARYEAAERMMAIYSNRLEKVAGHSDFTAYRLKLHEPAKQLKGACLW